MKHTYLKLTDNQVAALKSNGCNAEKWDNIEVCEGFNPAFVRNVYFGGHVKIGDIDDSTVNVYGISKHLGLYNCSIYNSFIGNNVYISNIGSHIANYNIEDNVVIENVGTIACESESSFGNGVEVSSVNEAGGREVPIYDGLTSQVAYIIAMYRHRPTTVKRLCDMILEYAESVTSDRGVIGEGVVITNSTSIVNVKIGPYAVINSVSSLREGTVNSSKESPSTVGVDVIASDFIMACSSTVDTGSMLRRCFVGEGTMIENGFSAENSLFFANCHCNHGEACAVFAGPYTVTHHRATLLIAGYFSFFNAGSGANQSNHMYKSGPVHQGVHLRGCKFGSDAYILLPARTGAFTVVTGRHYSHYDTAEMPFSYIVDEEGESHLVPGINLRSCGTARDVKKWPKRDKRKGVAHDIINFEMMTPYTADRIMTAIGIIQVLLAKNPTLEVVTWNRVKIKQSRLRKGLMFYRQAINSYLSKLISEGVTVSGDYMPHGNVEEWTDIGGMIAPKSMITELLDDIDKGDVNDLSEVLTRLSLINDNYGQYVNDWVPYALSVVLSKSHDMITEKDIASIVKQGESDAKSLERAIMLDAGKDRAPLMAIGYGIDSRDEGEIAADFADVRDL